ncbi:hypothetical protein Bca4012_010989 [Brassica carinata]
MEAVSEMEFTLTVWCQDEEKRRNSRICDMLFIATSHTLLISSSLLATISCN